MYCGEGGAGNCKRNVNFVKKILVVVTAHSAHKNIYDQGSVINTSMGNVFCSAFHQAHENIQQTKDLKPCVDLKIIDLSNS